MKRKLDFGILLPTRGAILSGQETVDLDSLFSMAAFAEESGYHSLWVGDSVTAKPRLEVFSVLSALAVKTKFIKLGTSVVLAALRNPVLLAQTVATVDLLASGRVMLGVGVARMDRIFEEEFAACGVPFNQKAGRLEDVIRIMKRLWSEDHVTVPSKYYTINNVTLLPKPYQRPGVPIWVSSNNVERGLQRVARLGDSWLTNLSSVKIFKDCWEKVQRYAAEGGRDPMKMERCLYLTVNVNSDAQQARRDGEAFLTEYYHKPMDSIARDMIVKCGNRDEVAQLIEDYAEVGITTVILRFATANQMEQLRICTEEVLPRFH